MIRLPSDITEHWLFESKEKSKLEAWIWILANASKESEVTIRGKKVTIPRGSLYITQQQLMEAFGWKRKKVIVFLQKLEQDGLIKQRASATGTILEVQDETFLLESTEEKTVEGTTQGTSQGTTKGTTRTFENPQEVWAGNGFVTQTGTTQGTTGGTSEGTADTRLPSPANTGKILSAEEEFKAWAMDQKVTRDELEMLKVLKKIENFPYDYKRDLEYLRELRVEFPTVHLLEEVKKFATHKLDKPLKKKSNPRLALRNWISKAQQMKERRGSHAVDRASHEREQDILGTTHSANPPAARYGKFAGIGKTVRSNRSM